MTEFVVTTFDWVPPLPRGFVRDIRPRWALEEAELPYRVETTPFDRREASHLAHQPFGQVPWLTDGDLSVFESGAVLLHLGGYSDVLMPRDAAGRAATIEWLFAALNSVEMASLPWALARFGDGATAAPDWLERFLATRLDRLDLVLTSRSWLAADRFTVADIAMADVLRLVHHFDGLAKHPAARAYLDRQLARPAFTKALADQMNQFAAADQGR